MTEHMSPEEYHAATKKKPRIKNRSVTWRGQRFHSQGELDRWRELLLLRDAGEIENLRRQVDIELIGQNGPIRAPSGRIRVYRADAVYDDYRHVTRQEDGQTVVVSRIYNGKPQHVVEDHKGFPTEMYKMKRDILRAMGIVVVEHKAPRGRKRRSR